MPQIAQQDYLFLHLHAGYDDLNVEEKNQIQDFHKRGVLFDAIIFDGDIQTRVVADAIDVDDTIVVWHPGEGALQSIDVSLE